MKRNFTISGLFLLCFFIFSNTFAQNITVKGKVTDATTGESLPGVSVIIKGTTNGTQTDASGAFALNAASNSILSLSYVGYLTQTVTVTGGAPIVIKLVPSASDLQQVVVIGYGTQRKVDNTGAVSVVKGADIAKQASQNALSSLQGKVAGVNIINDATPGASPKITIRGLGTYFGNQNPLFVVDGVWYDDISFLNTQDIENISILKDASSTAIYGIRAANGVVLITTKRGIVGKPVINYTGYTGWQSVTNQVKLADGTEYATAVNELQQINAEILNKPVTSKTFPDPASYGKGTDWYSQILRNAFVMNHEISVNGGTEAYRYNYSFGYLDQDGIVRDNNYKRYTARISNDLKIGKILKVGFNAAGVFSKSNDIPGGIFHQLYTAAPVVPVFYNDGKYGDPSDYHVGDGNNFNPEVTLDYNNHRSVDHRFTGNVYGELNILKNLKFRTSFGGDIGQDEARGYTPIYQATVKQFETATSLDVQHTETRNWIWENTLTYDYQKNDHKLTALLGYSAQNDRAIELDAKRNNVPYTSKGNLHTSFPADSIPTYFADPNLQLHTRSLSQFARVNYSYKDTYLLNASLRHDGASQFYGNGNETYGYFPSVGAGWVITNESFMKDQHTFDNLKLRGSWGKVGNSVVPINPSVLVIDNAPGLTATFGDPPRTLQGKAIDQIVPPTIVWEKGVATDFGLEGAFLHNRLSFEADYYNRDTKDAIFPIPVLGSLGTTNNSLLANQADIRNRGFEFSLTWKDQVSNSFSYSVSGNFGVNDNKVLTVLSGKNAIYSGGSGIANGDLATRTVVGQPIGEFYGYQVIGVFQNKTQIANSKQKDAIPGDFIYQDTNNDGVISSTDRVNLGNPNPKITYGLNTSFTYKQFDLAMDFQGVADVSVYNANLAYRFGNENITQDFFDHRWHGEGTSNTYPSMNIGSEKNARPNSFYVSSGAYFRVRNLQLGYTLPNSAISKLGIQKIRFYANAQNAINVFGYKGFNPEVGGSVGNLGIDSEVYPLYATYNFGVNVTF